MTTMQAGMVKQLLQDVECGKIRTFSQSCLYIDVMDGRAVLPDERVSQNQAHLNCDIAGELWAEVHGHFPWDFKFMKEKVNAFELATGLV
jgi:hypothetical protein